MIIALPWPAHTELNIFLGKAMLWEHANGALLSNSAKAISSHFIWNNSEAYSMIILAEENETGPCVHQWLSALLRGSAAAKTRRGEWRARCRDVRADLGDDGGKEERNATGRALV